MGRPRVSAFHRLAAMEVRRNPSRPAHPPSCLTYCVVSSRTALSGGGAGARVRDDGSKQMNAAKRQKAMESSRTRAPGDASVMKALEKARIKRAFGAT